jgi:hypothetical protein
VSVTFPETVSLEVRGTPSRLPDRTRNPILGFLAVFMMMMVLFLVLQFAGRTWFFVACLSAIPVFVLYAVVLKRRRQEAFSSIDRKNFQVKANARLRVSGNALELNRLVDIRDVPFEPVVFERVYAATSMPIVFALGMLVGTVLMILWIVYLPIRMNGGVLGGLWQCIGLVVVWLVARMRPTYYRVVPGRLEIMRFNALTNRSQMLKQWDLRSVRLFVAFDRQLVELTDGTGSATIRLWGISEPYKFVEALLQGAISTYPAPPLPDDQLLG